MRADCFKEGFVGNQVDLNLGQPKNDNQDEVRNQQFLYFIFVLFEYKEYLYDALMFT
jgi:hypothetical protein